MPGTLTRPCVPARVMCCSEPASLLAQGTALRAAFDLLASIDDLTVDPERTATRIYDAALAAQTELRRRFAGCDCDKSSHPDWPAAKRIMARLRAAHGACHAAALTKPLRELSRSCVRWSTCTESAPLAPLVRQGRITKHHRFGRSRLHRL